MSLRLKAIAAKAGIRHAELARAAAISRPALSLLMNHGALPSRYDFNTVGAAITRFLAGRGVKHPAQWLSVDPVTTHEDLAMLLRKQSLTPQARRHFNLVADPFADPATPDDVFLSPDIRYVRESMYQAARHGGFLAVIGESGGGKSTLREELIDRIHREEQAVIVIEPYVLAMESTDSTGKTLRSQHIAEAIMSRVAPLAKPRSSPEARFNQLHESLRDSSRAGHSHVLIIEEAHCLPTPTLKHLKRFRELKDGLRPLLSVVVIGQPELAVKLSEHNPELREVVQRIEIVTLAPLGGQLAAYLEHRFKRAGTVLDKVVERGAIDALRSKLTPTRSEGSLLYPLAVHNALAAAMNRAADLGVPVVTADVVRGV